LCLKPTVYVMVIPPAVCWRGGPPPRATRLFVEEFDQQIPFYSYHHVVKPGIGGWAQVRYGYAADADADST